jgi:hypothetical protein
LCRLLLSRSELVARSSGRAHDLDNAT